jgi:hypothetical protein
MLAGMTPRDLARFQAHEARHPFLARLLNEVQAIFRYVQCGGNGEVGDYLFHPPDSLYPPAPPSPEEFMARLGFGLAAKTAKKVKPDAKLKHHRNRRRPGND